MQFDQSINHDKTSFPAQFCEQDGHLSESQNSIKIITVINEWKVHVRKVNQDALARSSSYPKELQPRDPREKLEHARIIVGQTRMRGGGVNTSLLPYVIKLEADFAWFVNNGCSNSSQSHQSEAYVTCRN